MQPDSEDMARLWDMLDAAQAAMQFTNRIQFEDFLADRMVRNAVERNLEIIGEAARCVSQTFRDSLPEIPWRAMIALRNVLTHEYGEIRNERIWLICKEQLAVLIRQLEDAGVIDPPQTE
ncbi:MAG TPA: DUF86 domain-containing protein [Sedimentisphaerales bacterium]|nr:DUF86 domain-containing protein [Sedimentisphaerales bacterium]